jgi:hypothetical protein
VIAVAEVLNNVSAAALSMAIGASGFMSSYRTTALIGHEESVAAMKKAGEVTYQPTKYVSSPGWARDTIDRRMTGLPPPGF